MTTPPTLTLSRLEIRVADVARMAHFYSGVLGFVVTDRGEGADGMVFLSRNAGDHHQIVISPGGRDEVPPGRLDHVALRVDSLAALRTVFVRLKAQRGVDLETVSHGTTWSVYVRDPEGNRVEIFADSPWHVAQPVRFAVDLNLSDDELIEFTESRIRGRPGFGPASAWREAHRGRLGG